MNETRSSGNPAHRERHNAGRKNLIDGFPQRKRVLRRDSTMTSEVEMLAKRVGRLERENRLLKLIGIGCALGVAMFVLVGADKKPRTIEAEKIVLRDSQGRARVTIGTPEFAGVAIDMKASDPAIWLADESGADRAILSADSLRFGNSKGKPLVALIGDPRPCLLYTSRCV